jgi:hypothetical protein
MGSPERHHTLPEAKEKAASMLGWAVVLLVMAAIVLGYIWLDAPLPLRNSSD